MYLFFIHGLALTAAELCINLVIFIYLLMNYQKLFPNDANKLRVLSVLLVKEENDRDSVIVHKERICSRYGKL